MLYKFLLAFTILPHFVFSESGFIKNSGFINNTNQTPANEVLAVGAIQNGKIFFLKDRLSYVFFKNESDVFQDKNVNKSYRNISNSERIDFNFCNSNRDCKVEFLLPSDNSIRYIRAKNEFCTSSYKAIKYSGIWEGIDVYFYFSNSGDIKYDIVVLPGADISKIAFFIDGANKIELINNKLHIKTNYSEIIEAIPFSYQDSDSKTNNFRTEIISNFFLQNDTLKILASNYDASLPLIIDPWATFIGTPETDQAEDVAMDNFGNSYVTGFTQSLNFPVSVGAFQGNSAGDYDAFVFKLDDTGQRVWATYYGGSAYDFGYQIKIDSKGNPFISGYSYSSDLYVSSGTFAGVFDTYIVKLNSNGSFKWAKYFGGSGGEFTVGMGVSKSDKIVIAGFTSSQDLTTTLGAFQSTHAGALDIFIAVFDSIGNSIWTTYYGGTATDDAHAVNFDLEENVVVSGESYSADFPVSVGAYQPNNAGNSDIYILKFDSLGNRKWATLMGGTANEDVNGIATDTIGNIYIAGFSQGTDFPIVGNPFQPVKKATKDVILVKFSPAGLPLWSTFFGGDSVDVARALTVTPDQFILIGGETFSSDFPIVGNAFQPNKSGGSDIFYAAFDSSGTPVFSSYRGGAGSEVLLGISADTTYKVTMCGFTYSANFPVTPGVFQTTYSGNEDVFVWQIDSTQGVPVDTTNKGSGEGINVFSKTPSTIIFPNPTNGFIALNSNFSLIEIFDSKGSLVKTIASDYRAYETISLKLFTPGLYHLKCSKNNTEYEILKLILLE